MRVILAVLFSIVFSMCSDTLRAEVVNSEEVFSGQEADQLSNAYYTAALSYFWEEQYSQALRELETAIETAPKDARYWYFKALAEMRSGKPQDAYGSSIEIANRLAEEGFPTRSKVGTALERIQGRERIWLTSPYVLSESPPFVPRTTSVTTPEQVAPVQPASEQTAPTQITLEQIAPRQTSPEQIEPGQMVPELDLVSTADDNASDTLEIAPTNFGIENYQDPATVGGIIVPTEYGALPSYQVPVPASSQFEPYSTVPTPDYRGFPEQPVYGRNRALFARERAAMRVLLGSGNSYVDELQTIRANGWLLNRGR